MADELQITVSGTFTNGSLKDTISSNTFKVTQSTQGMTSKVWSIGTSEEDLALDDITTNGYIYMLNLDTTNYVKFGPKSGGSMIELGRLRKGEFAVFRLASGVTLRAIADTAACKVLVKAYED